MQAQLIEVCANPFPQDVDVVRGQYLRESEFGEQATHRYGRVLRIRNLGLVTFGREVVDCLENRAVAICDHIIPTLVEACQWQDWPSREAGAGEPGISDRWRQRGRYSGRGPTHEQRPAGMRAWDLDALEWRVARLADGLPASVPSSSA